MIDPVDGTQQFVLAGAYRDGERLAVSGRDGAAEPAIVAGGVRSRRRAGSGDGDLYGHASAHDVAAVGVLVREAGGRVTDRRGRDQRCDMPVAGCVASNGLVHDELVARWRP